MCQACASSISKGDDVVPIQPSQLKQDTAKTTNPDTNPNQNCGARSRSIWIHAACAASVQGSGNGCEALTVCKHWRKTGTCLFGPSCTFAHPAEQAGGKSGSIEEGRSWQSIAAAGGPVHLHATGIPLDVDMEHLMSALEEHGKVLEAVEVKQMKRHSSGWAVVKYASFQEANRAVAALNGKLQLKRTPPPASSPEHASVDAVGAARTGSAEAEKAEKLGVLGSEKTDGAADDYILDGLAWDEWEVEEVVEEEEKRGGGEEGKQAACGSVARQKQGASAHTPVLRLWFAQLKRKKIRNEFRSALSLSPFLLSSLPPSSLFFPLSFSSLSPSFLSSLALALALSLAVANHLTSSLISSSQSRGLPAVASRHLRRRAAGERERSTGRRRGEGGAGVRVTQPLGDNVHGRRAAPVAARALRAAAPNGALPSECRAGALQSQRSGPRGRVRDPPAPPDLL